jgi:hypothetical protein
MGVSLNPMRTISRRASSRRLSNGNNFSHLKYNVSTTSEHGMWLLRRCEVRK